MLLNEIKSWGSVAVDTETTGVDINTSDLIGVSLAWKDKSLYIPIRHQDTIIDSNKTIKQIKSILEDNSIAKIGHNLKFDYQFLKKEGIKLNNMYMDTMIAAYCLDTTQESFGLKQLVLKNLGVTMTKLEEIVPESYIKRNKLHVPVDKIDLNILSKYAADDAKYTLELARYYRPMLTGEKRDLFYKVEMPLVRILAEMEYKGISINRDYMDSLKSELIDNITNIENSIKELSQDDININSPKQISELLFKKIGLKPTKKTKTGYSTDVSVLTQLSNQHEIPRLLLNHREYQKLNSTYVEGLEDKLYDNVIHGSFNQTITATGRLSSSNPNLQNIPIKSELGKKVRRMFVPRDGYMFVSADYSQIDLRSLAHLSNDKTLVDSFNNELDIHIITASQVFNVPENAVNSEQRRAAKTINFGIVYGQQAYSLSKDLNITPQEAQRMINMYYTKYKSIRLWMNNVVQGARKDRYVTTYLGRRRTIKDILNVDDKLRAYAERMAVNTCVQGTSADIIKVAMLSLDKQLGNNINMLIQVHDDILFEIKKDSIDRVVPKIKEVMESCLKLSVPLLVDVKYLDNWAYMKKYKFTP